ncbi:SDR family oxidoreductase [Virgibacillus sp. W0430]|uniref:SDR family oxidoreductase n=1 Tax=Virgibacillus sp. W0430 TaxID=3391580 RepID=UPI003F48ACA6
MKNLFDLTGYTAVITGGTSTLGSEMAIGLAEHGANVAITGRDEQKGRKVVNKIESLGVKCKFFHCDVLEKSEIDHLVNSIYEWTENVDVLLNAPGANSPTPFLELNMEEWDKIMDVNLKGTVMTCQSFAKKMIDQKHPASIINISSVSSETPLSKVFTYSASKSGINSITKSLALVLAPYNIRVNAIVPGFFPAEQNKKILSEDRKESIIKHTPMARFGEAKELKGVAIWLASHDASSFVTGSLVNVDGGFTSMTI